MGWDCHLSTTALGLFYYPWMIVMWASEQMRLARANSQLDYQRALAVTRDASGAVGDGKWEFSLSIPVGLQEFFYMP
jgi:hypothetical protein